MLERVATLEVLDGMGREQVLGGVPAEILRDLIRAGDEGCFLYIENSWLHSSLANLRTRGFEIVEKRAGPGQPVKYFLRDRVRISKLVTA